VVPRCGQTSDKATNELVAVRATAIGSPLREPLLTTAMPPTVASAA